MGAKAISTEKAMEMALKEMNKKYHTYFGNLYENFKGDVVEEWKDMGSFLCWLLLNADACGMESHVKAAKIDPGKPYGPDNCAFYNGTASRKSRARNTKTDNPETSAEEAANEAITTPEKKAVYTKRDIGRMAVRLAMTTGTDFMKLHKKIKNDACNEWQEPGNFLAWCTDNIQEPEGTNHVSVKKKKGCGTKPYSPETTEFIQLPEPVKKSRNTEWRIENPIETTQKDIFMGLPNDAMEHLLKARTHARFKVLFKSLRANGGTTGAWKTYEGFLKWSMKNRARFIPGMHVVITRKDTSKPHSPGNTVISFKGEPVKDMETFLNEEELKAEIFLIKEKTGTDYMAMYKTQVSRGKIDPEIWSKNDFLRCIADLYKEGKAFKGMHMHKIREGEPYSSENVYWSLRQGNGTGKGLSFTKPMQKYNQWKTYYKNRFERVPSYEDFLERILELGYKYAQNTRTAANPGEPVGLENLYLEDTAFVNDLLKLKDAYDSIPEGRNAFESFTAFVEWSAREGYASYKDLRKVTGDSWNPGTCKWDIFTKEGYEAHYRTISGMVKRKKNLAGTDPLYAKRANLKTGGGICKEWEDMEVFRKWAMENNLPGHRIMRIDTKKPFGPDNVVLRAC